MIAWIADTLLMTGALMVLVLLLRKPVGRWFGPQAAYALWALPMIRLLMPPLAIPQALAPTALLSRLSFGVEPITAVAADTTIAAAPAGVPVDAAMTMPVPTAALTAEVAEAGFMIQWDWTSLALAVWLAGAFLFLAWRVWNYQVMRRELLCDARPVARSGDVRIVESPAVAVPLAFGVFDKVVALPAGFLAEVDSEASDFAIAHELEHHAGGDLAAIMAVQPLFALHWFNPLAWLAWRALRGDQETACDARVMEGRDREEKARYGALIASFANGSGAAMAAPMAGGLPGDKPIIHRLKALARKDVSPARRVMARSLFALAVVAVPMTATVSYAAMEEEGVPEALEPPQPPQVLEVPGTVPPVPAAPDGSVAVPAPPAPPAPPEPPAPVKKVVIHKIRMGDGEADAQWIEHEVDMQAREAERLGADAERWANEVRAHAPQVTEFRSADGKKQIIRIVRKEKDGSAKDVQEMVLDQGCPADSHRTESKSEHNGSKAHVVICTGAPRQTAKLAIKAIRQSREAIAADRNLDAQVRAEIIADLDREIAEQERDMASGK